MGQQGIVLTRNNTKRSVIGDILRLQLRVAYMLKVYINTFLWVSNSKFQRIDFFKDLNDIIILLSPFKKMNNFNLTKGGKILKLSYYIYTNHSYLPQ